MPPSSEEPVNRGPVFVDGGIVANNPVMVALKEAMSLWPGREVGCIVSLGCGRRAKSETSAGGLDVGRLKKLLSDPELAHKECLQDLNIAQAIDTVGGALQWGVADNPLPM